MKNILKRLTFKRSDLGEGISYDGTEQTLTWVDIPNSKVFEYNKNANCKVFTLGAHSSFVAKTINNHYLSGGSEGLTLDGKFGSEAIKLENDIINDVLGIQVERVSYSAVEIIMNFLKKGVYGF